MTAADLIAEIDARLRRHHNDNGMVYLETPTGYFAPWQQIKTIRAALASRVVRDDWKALRGIPLAEAGLP
jgi:hypothetical protein